MRRSQLRDLLTFTSKERNGIIVLCVLLFLSITFAYIMPGLNNQTYNNTPYDHEVYAFQKSLRKKSTRYERQYDYKENKQSIIQQHFNLKNFDPNTVSKNELVAMGFNQSQVKNVLNYRKSGAVFYSKEDFLKMYTIDSSIFVKLKPYILIPDRKNDLVTRKNKDKDNATKHKPLNITIPIEMNSCTEDELVTKLQVPYYLAQRIIKYRDLLGGYVSYDQLADVYGFNNYELDTSRIIINFDHDLVKKINLNESEFKEIISHPYIDKYTTQAILEYRKFMKSIKTIDELVENNVIAGEKMERIQPYLEVK